MMQENFAENIPNTDAVEDEKHCPICGAKLASAGFKDWPCLEWKCCGCGISGKACYKMVFDRHIVAD